MVDIVFGAAIPPVQNNANKRDNPRRQAPSKKLLKERRKNRQDRREDIRSGVTVTLSKYPERRVVPDRRKAPR
jgi:HEAT repeat protein